MKSLLIIAIFFMSALYCTAQDNLVQNPSFENGKYTKMGAYDLKNEKQYVTGWYSPLRYKPDLYVQPKRSVARAKTGWRAIGLILGSSRQRKTKFEYITGTLKAPLVKDQVYCICFDIILQRTSRWAATDVGLLLHHDRKVLSDISDPSTMTASIYANGGDPVKNTKWQRYCGYYRASGGEKYLSFGKFGNSESVQVKELGMSPYFEMDGFQSKAYYQIDDISVLPLDENTDCGCAEGIPEIEEEVVQEEEIIVDKHYTPYLFALDASGSMKKGGLFDSLRVNLIRFLDQLPLGSPVSFVTFASSSRKVFSGVLKEGTASMIDSLLSRAPIGGGTNVALGLQLGYGSWQSDYPDSAKMILISDGEFHVKPKIVELVKNEFETKGRKITIVQIGASATGLAQIKPYMDSYIHTTPTELSQVVSKLYVKEGGMTAGSTIASTCDCIEEYSDTMNYHFVIDYSGSMSEEKGRAISALRYLFNKAPDNSIMSITAFTRTASQLYVGKKSDITMARLSMLLQGLSTGGGTDPVPGVQHALKLAKTMDEGRFSHVIVITDYSANQLSRLLDLGSSLKEHMEIMDLAACAIQVDGDGLIATHSQFDVSTVKYLPVNRMKFERDLFYTKRSSCDYTSEVYHYNPVKAALKQGAKRVIGKTVKGMLENSLGF